VGRKPAILASLAAGRVTPKLRGDEQKRRRGQERTCGEWPKDYEAVFRQLHGRRRTCAAKVHDPYSGRSASVPVSKAWPERRGDRSDPDRASRSQQRP